MLVKSPSCLPKFTRWCTAAVVCLLLLNACKKEYPDYPYNDIKQFVIKNVNGADLKAAFNNNDIILYWPPFVNVPDSITPQITVAERAAIHPASGTKVPFNETTVYTVTAQDGSIRTYKLVVATNQPPLAVKYVQEPMKLGAEFEISGEYFIPDTNQTKLYLVSGDKKVFQLYGNSFNVFNHGRISTIIPLSDQLDTVLYSVQLVSGVRSITKGPFKMNRPDLVVQLAPGTTNVKVGGSIEFTVPPAVLKFHPLTNIESAQIMTTSFELFTVQSQLSGSSIRVTLPAALTAGMGIYSVSFLNAQGEPVVTWEDYLQPLPIIE